MTINEIENYVDWLNNKSHEIRLKYGKIQSATEPCNDQRRQLIIVQKELNTVLGITQLVLAEKLRLLLEEIQ